MKTKTLFTIVIIVITGMQLYSQNYPDKTIQIDPIPNLYFFEYGSKLYIHPQNADTLFFRTTSDLNRSYDGGQTWVPQLLASWNYAKDVAFDPVLPNVVYFASEIGLNKSENMGQDLQLLLSDYCNSIAIPKGQNDTIYAAGTKLRASYNGGETFEIIEDSITNIWVSSANTSIYIKATIFGTVENVEISYDKGETWVSTADSLFVYNIHGFDPSLTPVDTIYQTEYWRIDFVFDPSDENIFYIETSAGIFRTEDKGITFHSIVVDDAIGGIVVDKNNPATVHSATEGGFYTSTDRGNNWTKTLNCWAEGNVETHPYSIAISDDSQTIWGTFNGRMFRKDGFDNWQENPVTGVRNYFTHSLILSETHDTIVVGSKSVFYSSDNCETWTRTPVHYNDKPAGINKIVRVPGSWDEFYVAGNGDKLYKTSNQGATFQLTGVNFYGEMTSLLIDENNPQTLYMSYRDSGVYKTNDGGLTYETKNNGLDTLQVTDMIFDIENSNILYAAAKGVGVYKTEDGAENWTLINNGIDDEGIDKIFQNPNNPDILFAYNYWSWDKIYKSVDRGNNWERIEIFDFAMFDLTFDPDNPDVMYAACELTVKKSEDGGYTWFPWYVNEELGRQDYIKATRKGIYLSTSTRGLNVLNEVKIDTVDFDQTVTCIYDSTASIEIKTAKYHPEALYSIDGGETTSSDSLFINLPAGEYFPVAIINEDTLSKGTIYISYEQSQFIEMPDEFITTTNDTTELAAPDGFESYLWGDNTTGQTHTFYGADLLPDDYFLSVTATDNLGCLSTDSILIVTEDNTPPTITCVGNREVDANENHSYIVNGNEFDPIDVNDNWGVAYFQNDFTFSESLAGAELPEGTITINWLVADNTGNESSCSFDISVNAYVGIEILKQNGIFIYPNPATDVLNFEFSNNDIQALSVFDIWGKELIKKTEVKQAETINLSGFKSGIYIIKIQNKMKIHKIKIVKE